MTLNDLGWNDFHQIHFDAVKTPDLIRARVSLQQKKQYCVLTENGEYAAVIQGKLRHKAESIADFPVIGDWVLVTLKPEEDKAIIHDILPRRTKISRDSTTRKGRQQIADEQVLVANIDTIFLVVALNDDMNLRRIERYLTVIWDNGVQPVLVLNKADLCDSIDDIKTQINEIAFGVNVHVTSAANKDGIDELRQYLVAGKTAAFLGSSGVGKSTIINQMIGMEKFKVADIGKYKDKGRHITTHRELVVLESGGILIDNPGMRSIQLWDGEEGLTKSFEDVEQFAAACRFNDCKHQFEPGCAVLRAVESGDLDRARYNSYLKLQSELDYRSRKENWVTRQNTKKRWKTRSKIIRQMKKNPEEE